MVRGAHRCVRCVKAALRVSLNSLTAGARLLLHSEPAVRPRHPELRGADPRVVEAHEAHQRRLIDQRGCFAMIGSCAASRLPTRAWWQPPWLRAPRRRRALWWRRRRRRSLLCTAAMQLRDEPTTTSNSAAAVARSAAARPASASDLRCRSFSSAACAPSEGPMPPETLRATLSRKWGEHWNGSRPFAAG